MPALTGKVPGEGTGTLTFTIPGEGLDLESVYAEIDNTAGGSAVTAELTLQDQSGVVIARKKQGATIPAGGSGSATWALRLDDESTGSTPLTGYIRFNVDNEGGWFLLGGNVAIPSGPLAPAAVGLYDSGSGGGLGFWDGNFGGGITLITGPKAPWSFGFGGIQLLSNAGGVTVYASQPATFDSDTFAHLGSEGVAEVRGGAGVNIDPDPHVLGSLLTIPNLPIVAPAPGSNAIWNNGGVLNIA